jgi:hypothetical protein
MLVKALVHGDGRRAMTATTRNAATVRGWDLAIGGQNDG